MAYDGFVADNGVAFSALEIGSKIVVNVGNSPTDAQTIGFIDSMRATKNMQIQRAQVCGSVMPASLDPQTCQFTISLSGFIAKPEVYGQGTVNGNGDVSIAQFNPSTKGFMDGTVNIKFPYLEFKNKTSGKILASFQNCVVSNYNITVQGGTYAKADVQMEATNMSDGDDYLNQ